MKNSRVLGDLVAEGNPRQEALAKFETLNDPLRMELFTALIRKPASAVELAAQLDVPIGRIRYQLGRMREADLVEVRERRPRRGVVEQVYVSRPTVLSIADTAQLTPDEIRRGHAELLKMIVHDCLAALRKGTFYSREDFMAVRLPLRLDEEGWKAAADLQHETLESFLEIHVEAQARIGSSEAETIDVLALLFLFEAAPENSGK
jgi:DNA-binding transcriptional ArsR family regulator